MPSMLTKFGIWCLCQNKHVEATYWQFAMVRRQCHYAQLPKLLIVIEKLQKILENSIILIQTLTLIPLPNKH